MGALPLAFEPTMIEPNKILVLAFENERYIVKINYKVIGCTNPKIYSMNFLFNITKGEVPPNTTFNFYIDTNEIEDVETIENYKLNSILNL